MLKKAFVVGFVLALSLFGASNKEVEEYKMSIFKNNKQVSVKSVKTLSRERIENDWEAVALLIEFTIDRGGKKITMKVPDMVFVKGELLSDDLINLKSGKSLKESVRPKPDASYYDAEHLVAGNRDAKNRVVVFSDPLCPFCRDVVPDMIAAATKHPSKLAIYHYSFPLISIHPASEAIVKAEISARGAVKNRAEFVTKLYATGVDPNEMDEAKIAAKLSGELGIRIQQADIGKKETQKEYDEELQKAYRLLIRGTPTIYVNGELDASKAKINQLLKELK